jgi:hypothetical protein
LDNPEAQTYPKRAVDTAARFERPKIPLDIQIGHLSTAQREHLCAAELPQTDKPLPSFLDFWE